MAEKKTTKAAATEKKAAAPKKTATRKCAAKKTTAPVAEAPVAEAPVVAEAVAPVLVINSENAGFRAGDVYQALAAEQKALTVAEIAKVANITELEVILGSGWLLKEGKIKGENGSIVLA